jgi:hypothetical protein
MKAYGRPTWVVVLCLIGGALLLAAPVSAVEDRSYYVAADGAPANDGSKEHPWPSIEYALERVGGGHTIVVRPGQYRGPITISKAYAGTAAHPTVIRSEVKWQAVVFGSTEHGIYTADQSHWVVIDGLRVYGSTIDGIKISGNDSVVRNCWVHNNNGMGVAMHGRTHGTIEDNLIEFNGHNIQFDHGVYADGDGLIVRRNIVRHNSGFGLHLYPSISHSVISQNLVYGHFHHPGIIVACPPGGGQNIVANNTVVERNGCLSIWAGNGEKVVNNIFISDGDPIMPQDDAHEARVEYNLCQPKSAAQSTHAIAGAPKFVDEARGLFWLQPGSAALGAGTSDDAPETDFWGRPLPRDTAPDLGAFAFVPSLAAGYHRQWGESGWPYEFRDPMPDLWAPPVGQSSANAVLTPSAGAPE